jgi:hypothetical protein
MAFDMHRHSLYSLHCSTVAVGFNVPSSDRARARRLQLGIVARWMRMYELTIHYFMVQLLNVPS